MANFTRPVKGKTRNIRKSEPTKPFPTDDQLAEMCSELSDGESAVLIAALTASYINQTDGFTPKNSDELVTTPVVSGFAILNGVRGLELGEPFRNVLLSLQQKDLLRGTRSGSYIPMYFSTERAARAKTVGQNEQQQAVSTLLDRIRSAKVQNIDESETGKTRKSA